MYDQIINDHFSNQPIARIKSFKENILQHSQKSISSQINKIKQILIKCETDDDEEDENEIDLQIAVLMDDFEENEVEEMAKMFDII